MINNYDTLTLSILKVHPWIFTIAYHRLNIHYAIDLSCTNRKRLEVSKNVKYIAVASRASKLQVSKVGELWDLNPQLPRESVSLC